MWCKDVAAAETAESIAKDNRLLSDKKSSIRYDSVSRNSNQAPSQYKSEANLLKMSASVQNTTVSSSLLKLTPFQDPH